MKIEDAQNRADLPLVVEHPVGGIRVIAELFVLPIGVFFLDIGWPEASLNPIHLLPGEFKDDGPPWVSSKDSQVIIRALLPFDRCYGDYILWRKYLESPDSKGVTRDRAKEILSLSLKGRL